MDVEVKPGKDVPNDSAKNTQVVSVAQTSLINIERTADEFLRVAFSGEASPPDPKRGNAKQNATTRE